jgi:hypothetical protein
MKLRFSALIAVPVVMALPTSAHALGETFPDGFPSVNPLNWTQDVSISSSYSASYVVPAINSWNNISSKVTTVKVSSGAYKVRVLVDNVGDFSVAGRMIPFCAAGSLLACFKTPNGNATSVSTWTSAKVIGYEDAMTANGWTGTNIIQTFTHEFGHALSLKHVTSTSAATMAPAGPSNNGVQAYDKANLKAKWGN